MSRLTLDKSQVNTVLAALRYYQQHGQGDPCNRSLAIHDIAVDGDEISLDASGIDELCEYLNEAWAEDDPVSGLGENQKRFLRELGEHGKLQPRVKLWIGVADALVARGLVQRLGSGPTVRYIYQLTAIGSAWVLANVFADIGEIGERE